MSIGQPAAPDERHAGRDPRAGMDWAVVRRLRRLAAHPVPNSFGRSGFAHRNKVRRHHVICT